MAKTGPQKIPGASQANFYGAGQYSGSDMEVNCGVVHTTEGLTLPTYSGGAMAPNVTGVPDIAAKKIRWYQHFDVDESARALENRAGGVSTNTANAFQIELVGTCDDSKETSWSGKKAGVDYLHWPTAPDWALAEVAWLVRWLHDNHAVPLTCVKDWLAYGKDSRRPGVTPASYGASPARMTFAEWQAFKGWCGHSHVPENDHGDPGSMNFARVIELAKGDATPQEDDMPTAAEIAKAVAAELDSNTAFLDAVAKAVVDRKVANPYRKDAQGNPAQTPVYAFLRSGDDHFDRIITELKSLGSQAGVVLTDQQVATLGAAVAANPALASAIAGQVAQQLAARLAE